GPSQRQSTRCACRLRQCNLTNQIVAHPDPLPAKSGERETSLATKSENVRATVDFLNHSPHFAGSGSTYFVISSISAMSSALSVQDTAFTFCSTCSTRVAPAMTLATCGCAASQEKASSSR